MKVPEIRIQFTWLLVDSISKELEKKYKPTKESTLEDYEKWAGEYRAAWAPVTRKILTGMQDVFGLQFKRQYIDVALAPWMPTMSNPLIIGFQYEPDEFVDALAHELFHVLFTDNTVYSTRNGDAFDVKLDWKKLYGSNHTNATLVHIPVHAGLKYIYLDILKEPKRLERDIKFSDEYVDYKKTWEYVEQNDYKEIIQKLKRRLQKIRQFMILMLLMGADEGQYTVKYYNIIVISC